MKLLLPIIIAIAAIFANSTVSAQVYKCVDKDGKVQYSDIPPPADAKCGVAKKLDTRVASSPLELPPATSKAAIDSKANKDGKAKGKDSKDGPKTLADQSKDFNKRRADEADAAKKDAETERLAKAKQVRCTEFTNYLRDLETGQPLASSNEKGERVILDDAGRAAQIDRARTAMNESCK